jgi:transposase
LYLELDKPALKALPAVAYRCREFKYCKVNIDYHILLEKDLYSVPYQLVGEVVNARYTSTTVEIYHKNKRVAVHPRGPGKGVAATQTEHMASAHRAVMEWSPSRMISWGRKFGAHTEALMEEIMAKRPHPEMGFRSCLGILNRAKSLDVQVVEAVSQRMLELGLFTVKNFKNILRNRSYEQSSTKPLEMTPPDSYHENVRGQRCYQ